MVALSELPEGSSSSSSTQGHRYDVLLSFRGVDTRLSFTNHLHNALINANITTFLDDGEIETGEDLKQELVSAIKASKASIIVLSKNYATSTWCLDELVLILEQRRTSNHIVIPVFYHVEPTHVRKQKSSFGEAMTKHRQMMEAESNANKRSQWAQKLDRWNKALREVADLCKWQVELIDEIVLDVFHRLRKSSRFPLPQLIGMDKSIEFVTSWLKDGSSHTPDILTISGIGGIGKTSLAKYVYALHCQEFDTSNFIEDITTRCDENSTGMLDVQKQLYNDISKSKSTLVQVHDESIYTLMIENAIARKKVFLVLDDIGTVDQLDALLGSKGFHPGTKIIITTNNARLAKSCALFKTNVKLKHTTYMLKGLSETESQKLLCFHAFMCNDPMVGYDEVLKNLVKYCEGHPMALKVLGRSLHNRDVTYWEEYIDKLKKENAPLINNVLKLSFDSLPFQNDKELFKLIACFFVGMDKDATETILKACDIHTRSGITNLIDKCLLSMRWNNELMYVELIMHHLVQQMGKFLVRKESLDKPWEQIRLWCHEESFKVLKQNKGTENVLGLTLDMKMIGKEMLSGSCKLKTDALSKMNMLMLLQLNYVQITGSYKNFPKELRWLCMHGLPLKSIPLDLPTENLVALDLSCSNIESFGIFYSYAQGLDKKLKQLTGSCSNDQRLLGSLKIINLSFCKQLHSLGFCHFPKLERLILRGCIGFLEVCESIEQCVELVFIDMSYCKKLERLPRSIGMLKKVQTLVCIGLLEVCDSTDELQANTIEINKKRSSLAVLEATPSDLKLFAISLPRFLVKLSLANNNLSTESFPMDLSSLFMLKELYLDDNPIVSLPSCLRSLPRLERLSMVRCNMLISVENPPHTLKYFRIGIYSVKSKLKKIVVDMSTLDEFIINWKALSPSSFEYQGLIKIQPMVVVEEKILCSLGWTKQDFPIGRRVVTFRAKRREDCEIQMYYQFGIFNTIYGGKEMPHWIIDRSMGTSISFTTPSSPNKLKGLNFCCVLTSRFLDERLEFVVDELLTLPRIEIHNITKNLTWVYYHYIQKSSAGGKCLTFLSHWMFGMNDMECGDHITITMYDDDNAVSKECGVSFVYDNGDTNEEDVLGYYKSWRRIIGRDLTKFQSITGTYLLDLRKLIQPYIESEPTNI